MLFPGELRPSVTGQDPADFSHTPDPTAGPTPSTGITTTGPLTSPDSSAGRTGFVSVGNRKVKAKLKPGQPPPPRPRTGRR